jgi:hypothetical protein
MFDNVPGTEGFNLPLAHGAAAHIAGGNRALLAQQDGASGQRCFVLRMPDLQSRNWFESGCHSRSAAILKKKRIPRRF